MVGNSFHRLEPFVGIPKLRQHQRIVQIGLRIVVLKPMLVARQLFANDQCVIETRRNVAVGNGLDGIRQKLS